mmetsp:Transcript_115296/g.162104  ORF Transcript_115296/g.162104 Transcript_115296/m.162104 type:complete len:81 (+) Transcript_115296:28-270(+)
MSQTMGTPYVGETFDNGTSTATVTGVNPASDGIGTADMSVSGPSGSYNTTGNVFNNADGSVSAVANDTATTGPVQFNNQF